MRGLFSPGAAGRVCTHVPCDIIFHNISECGTDVAGGGGGFLTTRCAFGVIRWSARDTENVLVGLTEGVTRLS